MSNSFLLKAEVILLCLSFWYILFYIANRIRHHYGIIKNIVSPSGAKSKQPDAPRNVINVKRNDSGQSKTFSEDIKKEKNLSETHKNRLIDIIKKVRVNTSKSYYEAAKSLIVEWLAIDKFNKELNLELAMIYEAEKNFKNAEYVYRDLIEIHNENYEILKKLGYILALQKRYIDSISMYEQAFSKNMGDIEVIDLLTDLHYEIWNYSDAFKYVIMSLKEKPRNIERLILRAELSLREGKQADAVIAYRQVLEMQPYNTDAIDGLRNLGEKTNLM